ncbi:MAG: hypothetical protein ACI9YH_005245 [Colwellia sp.]|mgnify:CR=1 FL=1|jgi:hypothetical protein
MPYKKHTLLILVIIILVSLIFSHNLYGYLEISLDKLSSFSKETEDFNTQLKTTEIEKSFSLKTAKEVNHYSKKTYSHKTHSSQVKKTKANTCKPLLTDITTAPQKYTHDDGSISYINTKKYYELETNLGKGYEPFLTELKLKLNATFQYIERQLGIKLMKKIKLNFVFQTSRADYENHLRELGHSPEGNQGIYLSSNNLSIIEFKNHKQGIKTAIHEAIHTFNRAYWGRSFRFFNEGMAEYFEPINTKGILPSFNFSSLKHQQYPMQISTLLFSEADWHGDNNHELYQNSKALFHFLMNNKQGRKVVLKIMKLEMKNHCTKLSKATIEDVFFNIFPNHEQEFNYWFSDELSSFLDRGTTQ